MAPQTQSPWRQAQRLFCRKATISGGKSLKGMHGDSVSSGDLTGWRKPYYIDYRTPRRSGGTGRRARFRTWFPFREWRFESSLRHLEGQGFTDNVALAL